MECDHMKMLTERTHFARLFTEAQVKTCLDMLESICDGQLADLMTREGDFITVRAPNGDVVFQALKKGAADAWVCRLHIEVFEE